MRFSRHLKLVTLLFVLGAILHGDAVVAQGVVADSTVLTPFRKGRWLLKMSGSISSSSVRTDSIGGSSYVNTYSLDLSGSKFIADKWALGMILAGERSGSKQFVDRTTETLFLGPLGSYYFSDNPTGSVFVRLSPGYSAFKNTVIEVNQGDENLDVITGQGVGFLVNLGYSLVLRDVVAFDLGFTYTSSWIWARHSINSGMDVRDENFRVGGIAFSFGFNVLL